MISSREDTIHGTLLRVADSGVLLTGPSGIGKSQLALELIHQGHALVADDHVLLASRDRHCLRGRGAPGGDGFLVVHGLGAVDVARLFGPHAVIAETDIHLQVTLVPSLDVCADPLRGHRSCRAIHGVEVAELSLWAARAGLATLVAVAARDAALRRRGYHADEALAARLGARLGGEFVMRMIVVSGLSGSGKSIALETLEDLNHYCVDNLPVELLGPFAETVLARGEAAPPTIAVGIDARNFPDALERFPDILEQLRASGLEVDILFLLADNESLLKRYSETRRPHPLSLDGAPLADAIQRERQLLEPIAAQARLIIDTSRTNVHELRQLIRTRVGERPSGTVSLLFISFGYRNGIPDDADFVFDVRCLPNPHWEPRLRRLTGLDDQVMAYLGDQPDVQRMVADLLGFLDYWVPRFEASDRSYISIAVGCTGGQHRSVFVAEALARQFRRHRRNVMTRHRELR